MEITEITERHYLLQSVPADDLVGFIQQAQGQRPASQDP